MTQATAAGRITDEGIRALRSRVGIPVRNNDDLFFEKVTADSIRNFAWAAGDTNPLYTDPAYARQQSRWFTPIAQGTILFATGVSEGRPLSERERTEGRGGGLPGVHSVFAGADFEWYAPMKDGDDISFVSYLAAVDEKHGQYAGREVLETTERVYRNQRREVVARMTRLDMRAERHAAAERQKYARPLQSWTREQLDAVDATYASERPRGRSSCYWEDVTAGEALPQMVRGPYTATDGVAWKMGAGFAPFTRSGRVAYEYRKRHPAAYAANEINVLDVPERQHWDNAYAASAGLPGYCDYGPQRVAWLALLLTNWMGDDAWLKALSVRVTRFNVLGDVQWLRGSVVAKSAAGGECSVRCEVRAENQYGEVTASGGAIVLLPSREHGPVRLPASGVVPYPCWDGPEGRVTPLAQPVLP